MSEPINVKKNTVQSKEQEMVRQYVVDCMTLCRLHEIRRKRIADHQIEIEEDELKFQALAKTVKEKSEEFKNSVLSQFAHAQNMLGEMFIHAGRQAEYIAHLVSDELKSAFGASPSDVKFGVMSAIKDKLFSFKNWVRPDDPEVALPVLTHFVEVDSKGVLSSDSISFLTTVVNEDGFDAVEKDMLDEKRNKFVRQLNGSLNEQIEKWLKREGYEVGKGQDQGKVYSANRPGVFLDSKAFAALRDDPNSGLTAYLKNEWKMEVQLREAPSSPRP